MSRTRRTEDVAGMDGKDSSVRATSLRTAKASARVHKATVVKTVKKRKKRSSLAITAQINNSQVENKVRKY